MSDETNNLNEQKILTEEEVKELVELNEGLSWAGKLFFASAVGYIYNQVRANMPLKIKGTPQQIKAIADAIVASKKFQEELKRPGATVESVMQKLKIKNMTREQFKAITGHDLPL